MELKSGDRVKINDHYPDIEIRGLVGTFRERAPGHTYNLVYLDHYPTNFKDLDHICVYDLEVDLVSQQPITNKELLEKWNTK